MANMELIEAKTLASATSSVTFTSIPQTYTDLKISVSGRTTSGIGGSGELGTISFSFGSTSYTYSDRFLGGNGTAPYSSANSVVATSTPIYWVNGSGSTASTFASVNIDIPNYTLNNAKSFSYEATPEYNDSTLRMMLGGISTTKTDPVTEIILTAGQTAFAQHTTFYLYGISNVTSTAKATGGIVSSDETYWYHMFPYSGTFTPTAAISADVLCIAGGGGSSFDRSGGGGAGGLLYSASQSLTTQAYTITIGSGGAGAPTNTTGSSGGNSTVTGSGFTTLTAVGGGYGAQGGQNGANGGSGGGSGTGGTGTAGQGNNGGTGGSAAPNYGAGAGGGAGAVGDNGTSTFGGNGGNGVNTYSSWANATQTGVNGYYAGGGGGGTYQGGTAGAGGLGGGGNAGAPSGNNTGTPGARNTGGGAGGSSTQTNGAVGAAGGSGLVIIRYAK